MEHCSVSKVVSDEISDCSSETISNLPYYGSLDSINQKHRQLSHLQDLETIPQGRHLGLFSIIVLFVSRMLGSGIFSISSGIYQDCGRSVGIFFLAWFIAALFATGGMYMYLEIGSIIPRSGGTKVFLEFIYQKPKLLATVAFLIYSIITGFTTTNILIFSEYFLISIGLNPSYSQIRVFGLLFLFLVAGIHSFSLKVGIQIQNVLGGMKIGLLFIMIFAGVWIIFFPSTVNHIENHLHWNDILLVRSEVTAASFASAIIKALFTLAGWNTVHTVSNEIDDPIKIFKIAGPVSLGLICISYFMVNVSYLLVIPDKEFAKSGYLSGSILFEKIFGYYIGRKLLTFSIALCAAGNVFVVLYQISRNNQEVFREGYLPFSRFMASNWPLGAPFRSLLLSVLFTTIIFIFLPDGDIISYIISYEGYGANIATLLVAIGFFIIRYKYPEIHTPIRGSKLGTSLVIVVSIYLIISPFTGRISPNPNGLQDWPSYAVLSTFSIGLCIAYWYFKFALLPWILNYKLVQVESTLSDGLVVKSWKKIYGQ